MTRLARVRYKVRSLARNYLFYTAVVYAIGVATGVTWHAILA